MFLSPVSTSHSEQSNKQHRSSVPTPATVYLISEFHLVVSEQSLPETFFKLVFNLLKRCFDISPTNGADFISTLWWKDSRQIKDFAINHTDTLENAAV